jgi:hypothetical protein
MISSQNHRARGRYGQSGTSARYCRRHLEIPCYEFGAESPLAHLITRTGS